MFSILKKNKQETLGFDLQIQENQRMLIKAALDNKIPLFNKGGGLFVVDMKHAKGDRLSDFLKQFMEDAINCRQGLIDKEDAKTDYILIYDLKED